MSQFAKNPSDLEEDMAALKILMKVLENVDLFEGAMKGMEVGRNRTNTKSIILALGKSNILQFLSNYFLLKQTWPKLGFGRSHK